MIERWAERPIWVDEGNYLLFSDIRNNTIYCWDEPAGITVFRQPSGFAKSNTLEHHGQLLSCEHQIARSPGPTGWACHRDRPTLRLAAPQ